jgi:regulator of ribonuclease activity A
LATVKVYEDNQLVREQLEERGDGRVIVIDGGGSLRSALVGDVLAQRAKDQGYAGIVVNGCVRDIVECSRIDIGLMALASNPTRPKKKGFGERGVPVAFGGVKFTPGEWLYADEDGIVVSAKKLI